MCVCVGGGGGSVVDSVCSWLVVDKVCVCLSSIAKQQGVKS